MIEEYLNQWFLWTGSPTNWAYKDIKDSGILILLRHTLAKRRNYTIGINTLPNLTFNLSELVFCTVWKHDNTGVYSDNYHIVTLLD